MPRLRLRPLLAAAALLCAAGGLPGRATAEIKIGYIDSAKIFQDFKDAQEAQQRFDRQVQGWRDEASEKEKAVEQLRKDVRDMGPILSALKRQEKEEALQRAISDYESFIQSIWGPSGKAASENERATGEVVAVIRSTVERLAGEKGLDLVLDSASGFIIYADKTMDLTAQVIEELNAHATSTSTPGAPAH
jgi:outer membrane protein